MRLDRLSILAFLLPVAVTVVACSSEPAKKKPAVEKTDKDKTEKDDDDDDDTKTSDSDLTRTTPPPTTARDAGLPPPPPNVSKPPPPTTRFCMDLSRCCGNMPDIFQQLACGYAATRGDETACGVALAVCQAGGVDFGNIFGDNNPECSSLSECCSELQRNGGDSTGCASVVEYQDEAWCRDMHASWRRDRWCR